MPTAASSILLGLWQTWPSHCGMLPQIGKRLRASSRRGSPEEPGSFPKPISQVLRLKQGRIQAQVRIKGNTFKATLDTGATRSFISEQRAAQIGRGRDWREIRTRIRLADGSHRDLTRGLVVTIHLGQQQVKLFLLVMPTVLDDILLGIDFLCGIKAIISCGGEHLQLDSRAELTSEEQNNSEISARNDAPNEECVAAPSGILRSNEENLEISARNDAPNEECVAAPSGILRSNEENLEISARNDAPNEECVAAPSGILRNNEENLEISARNDAPNEECVAAPSGILRSNEENLEISARNDAPNEECVAAPSGILRSNEENPEMSARNDAPNEECVADPPGISRSTEDTKETPTVKHRRPNRARRNRNRHGDPMVRETQPSWTSALPTSSQTARQHNPFRQGPETPLPTRKVRFREPIVEGEDGVRPDGSTPTDIQREESLASIDTNTSLTAAPDTMDPRVSAFLQTELDKFDHLAGTSNIAEHHIVMRDDKPIKQRYYPKNPAMQAVINKQVDELLRDGRIEPSKSPHSAPIVLVGKKTGDIRMCVDYRQLNARSVPDAYPLPRIHHILERLRNARFISTLDLKSGYWQIPVAPASREYTAFTVPGRGLFHWKVMPFGLHSAPATFQRALDSVIGPELEPSAFAYLDDIIVIGTTLDEHIENLREVFRRLRHANLKLNRDKCSFFQRSLKYLGHVISESGIHTDPDKIAAIRELQPPTNVRELRRCLGVASWYRRFVPNFAAIVEPISTLLRKGRKWSWDTEQEQAFETLKTRLTEAPVLACPDFTQKFSLQTDASDHGLGAVLLQSIDGVERVMPVDD
ncbi:uncharacterized protein [Drosophila kikkawai]|uniref:Reverse transcriptase domain-containing protein n=1 Tax=Drosophila kikkawai TaxID=30033 RepID=A0ABM4GC79_DROKI